jgi:hypothetical protein
LTRSANSLPPTLAPRGLQREVAAGYVGISASKFDEMVQAGRMPGPKLIDRRKVWDRLALDDAFDALPCDADENEWDKLTA